MDIKKILFLLSLILLSLIFLVPNVSAWDWDNIIEYEDNDMKVEIYNSWLIPNLIKGEQLGEVTLTSHNSVNEIRNVIRGDDRIVMTYKSNFTNEENLGEVIFTDMKTGKRIEKDYKIVELIYETIQVPEYERVCSLGKTLINESISQNCENNLTRYRKDKKLIDKREITRTPIGISEIGLMVDVGAGEYLDGVWTIAGQELTKHATWTEGLNTGLMMYVNFENGTYNDTSVHDQVGNYDGMDGIFAIPATITNTSVGIIGNAMTTDGTDVSWIEFPSTELILAQGYSVNAWFYATEVSNSLALMGRMSDDGTTDRDWRVWYGAGDSNPGTNYEFFITDTTPTSRITTGGAKISNTWMMITIIHNISGIYLYENGTYVSSSLGDWDAQTDATFKLSWECTPYGGGCQEFEGRFDEVGYWNRSLTTSEITDLYNGGAGITYTTNFDVPPVVTLNAPTGSYLTKDANIVFNYTCEDDIEIENVSLIIDAVYNITDTYAGNETNIQYTLTLAEGSHNWSVECVDNATQSTTSPTRTLTIDSTPPSINIERPINQTYIYLSDSVNVSLSENASLCWYELSELLGTNTSLTNRNDSVWSSSSNISIISGGQYINVWCNDSLGNVNQSTRYYSGDSTPPSFTLNVPVQNEGFLKLETPYNITSNVSITDDAVGVCWYYTSDNSTNVTYTCNELFNVTFTTGGNKTMYLYANDTFSNENTTSVDFFVNLITYTFTYENPTLEQIRQTITFEIFADVINSLTATNYYNGTAANTTFLSSNSTYGVISSSVVSPEVTADSEVFFYTNYTINGVNQLSTIENHSVRNIDIDNCTSYDNAILNFTMVDEELQTKLSNTTMEIAVNLYDRTRTSVLLNLSDSHSTNPTTICLNTNVTEEATYLMDVIVRYEETLHAIEYYNIVNFNLTNESELQDIILYDLNLTDSTEFQLTFIGSDYVAVEEALVYVDRQYIAENVFKTIELPKTDSNGQTILHLVRNDVVYNLRIVKNGVVLGNFENIIAFCEDATIGDCKISLNAFSSTNEIFDYDKDLGIIMTAATYNNATSIMSFNFLTSDGSSKEVRMEVTKADTFGNRSVCNDTLTSSGGTISCDVGTYNGEASLRVSIFVDDNLASFQLIELEPTDYGVIGFLFFFILVACMIMIFASVGKEGVLFGMVISMALGIGLGVIRGDMIGYGAAGLWIIIIAIIGIWKLNKEKAQ